MVRAASTVSRTSEGADEAAGWLVPGRGYPAAGGRGVFTEAEALERWPFACTVYEALAETGPCTASWLARWLNVRPDREGVVESALWWLSFADDNGCRRFVRGYLVDRAGAQVRFVCCVPSDGPDEAAERLLEARARAWVAAVDHETGVRA